jgi:hypothetical protein
MTTATYYLDGKGRQTINKDAGATLDYTFDWTDFLTPIADTIASVTATATGMTLVGGPTFTGNVVTVWATGGVVGTPASLTVTITTSSTPPRIEPMTVQFKITPKVT